MKTNSKSMHRNKDKKDNDHNIELLNKKALLNAINAIGSTIDLHFDNFEESLVEAEILRIVSFMFDGDLWVQDYITNIHLSNDSDLNKLNLAIKFLSNIESTFKVLLFDFGNKSYKESSLILFYSNLLNLFFLKKPKKELYDRCYTILYGKYNKNDKRYKSPNNQKEILCDWNTYSNLIYFIYSGKTNFDINEISSDENFKKFHDNFPMIVDENFLKEFVNEELPIAVYYQLQFIFDTIDDKIYNRYRKRSILIAEGLLQAKKMIRSIKVPPYEIMRKNIRDKNISLFIQQQRYRKISLNSKRKNEENEEKGIEIEKIHLSFEDQSFDDITIKAQEENEELQIDTFSFWDSSTSGELFDKGIIFKEENIKESLNLWGKIMTFAQKDATVLKDPKIKDYDLKELNRGLRNPLTNKKFIRLYNYIEELEQWVVDFSIFHADFSTAFADYCIVKNYNPVDPVILVLDSFESESVELISKLVDHDFKLNVNQISVYLVCNNFLSQITSNFDQFQRKTKYMPIFLILHVPKSKWKNPNIKTILLTAYSFLTFNCNINIVILNNKYCIDQLEFIRELYKINSVFSSSKDDIKNYQMLMKKKKEIEEESKKTKTKVDIVYNPKMYLMEHIDSDDFMKQNKLLILINDESIIQQSKADKNIMNEKIFKSLNDPSLNLTIKISFINIKRKDCYTNFITCLSEFLIMSHSGFKEFQKKQNEIGKFKFGFWYYYIRNEKDWKAKLKEFIFRRYISINKNNNTYLISKALERISSEIKSVHPILDTEFGEECNIILAELKKKVNINNIIFDELRKSSTENLNYIDKIVKNSPFWSDEQMYNVKNGHIHFLKQEYFNILKKKFTIKGFFETNLPKLNSFIEEDCEKINQMFEEFRKNMNKRKLNKIDMQRGTNYSIREKENEREIKVRVEIGGKLEDLIDQDF